MTAGPETICLRQERGGLGKTSLSFSIGKWHRVEKLKTRFSTKFLRIQATPP